MTFRIIGVQSVYIGHLWFPPQSQKASEEPADVWEATVMRGRLTRSLRQGGLAQARCTGSLRYFRCDSRGWKVWAGLGGISKWEALRFAKSCIYS